MVERMILLLSHIIKEVRKGRYIPILVISAKVELSDRILGIDLGADDYITKPFEALEVAAKVRAHLRRVGAQEVIEKEENQLVVGSVTLDCDKCQVTKDENIYELTKTEYKVLQLFMSQPGRVFTKEQIYEYAWGDDYAVDDNTIRVVISHLRDKIGSDYIKTIRTSGNGSGLGLAISAAIVEKHGGKLYVENEVSGYTKGFVIQMRVEE